MDDLDNEIFSTNTRINEYYSYDKLKNIIRRKRDNDLTVMYANISSLPLHMHELTNTLAQLNFIPDIIGLSETRITTKCNSYVNPSIPNYKYYQSQSSNNAGSVGVFIHNSMNVKIRHDLDITIPGLFETKWFDIDSKNRNKKITFGLVYRHPGPTDIPYFERCMEAVMSKLSSGNSNYYIFGDFNVNSLLYSKVFNITSFVDMMHSHSAVNLINKPTWFPRGNQPGAPSLLDHFYTNNVGTVTNLGLLENDISDHIPIVATIRAHPIINKIENPFPYVRDFKKLNLQELHNSLNRFTQFSFETDDLDTKCKKNKFSYFILRKQTYRCAKGLKKN